MPELPSANTPIDGKPITADDIMDSFKELDSEPEEKSVRKAKEAKEEDSDAEGEGEDEIDLVDPEADKEDEKLDLDEKKDEDDEVEDDKLEIDAPPRKREIVKKYPNLFKEFPFLEKMMFRDKAYTELFGSFDDAKESAEKAENFDHLEQSLFSGKTEEVLQGVKENDPRAFNIIVDDYLPTLLRVDKEAYFHVVGNLNKLLISELFKEGEKTGNDDLKTAAQIINQFVFNTSTYTPPKNLVDRSKETTETQSEAEKERLAFVQERFESSRDELQGQVDNTLKATISEYIDPKGKMSPYVKKNAVNDAMRMLAAAIAKDPSVSKNLDKLWRSSFEAKFSKDSLGKIKSFYLGRARVNLKNAIMKARAEALKDNTPREVDTEAVEERPARRANVVTGRSSQPIRKNEMRPGESVHDFFNRD